MTREEFIKILEEKGYSYKIEGDKIVVTHKNEVDLRILKTIPSDVEFSNRGYVYLLSLETLPSGIEFRNEGGVYLQSLKTLPSGIEFRNEGDIYLEALIGDYLFSRWSGNIKGIDSKRLLNLIIKKGIFE
jgi:hypothetical protein